MKVYELLYFCKNKFTTFQFENYSTGKYLGSLFYSEFLKSDFYYSDFIKFSIYHSFEYGYCIYFYI